ncbi:MAG TPA: hypothetical protein VMM60_18120 [Ilumatobacter sp.]|nr:hypothetical protein [Ilumatobacter sp.]
MTVATESPPPTNSLTSSAHPRDQGSMFVLTVLAAIAIISAVVIAVVPFANDLFDRQRAQAAADAAALAGVNGGRSESVDLASANGATLVAWEQNGRTVTVTVARGDATATARASAEP